MFEKFWDYLKQTDEEIKEYFSTSSNVDLFRPDHVREGVMSYLLRPAKRLRPAVMKLACGCLGGESLIPMLTPVAAGIELFHTWTLVHDDIIDNDDLRRGNSTAHILLKNRGGTDLNLPEDTADEYGKSIAILAGDIQHGWVSAAFLEPAIQKKLPAEVIVHLLHRLETKVIAELIYGEVLDVQYSIQNQVNGIEISEADVLKMEWLKTGALLEYSAQAGAMIAKKTTDFDDPDVSAIATFAVNCGIAFQLQDDILGIIGDAKQLGKPIGSDIREGKKTVIVLSALENANTQEREELLTTLGNRNASAHEVRQVINLLQNLGGVDYTRNMALSYISKANDAISQIPETEYKSLLYSWSEFMVNRKL